MVTYLSDLRWRYWGDDNEGEPDEPKGVGDGERVDFSVSDENWSAFFGQRKIDQRAKTMIWVIKSIENIIKSPVLVRHENVENGVDGEEKLDWFFDSERKKTTINKNNQK